MNEVSSRSHAVCIIIVEKCTTNEDLMAAAAAAGVGGWAKQAALAAQANGGKQSIKVSKPGLIWDMTCNEPDREPAAECITIGKKRCQMAMLWNKLQQQKWLAGQSRQRLQHKLTRASKA